MSADKGYCYAYRGAWTHPAFNDLREAAIWNFLYQNAFYEDGERNFNKHTFLLKRGQIVVSYSFLAKGFGMTDKGIRVVIQKLEKLGMLGIQGTSKGTILTICNYNEYQGNKKTEGKQEGNQGANEGQAKGKNNKKLSKEVNKKERNNIERPADVNSQVWDDFIKLRQVKKAPLTETSLRGILREATKANISLEQALEICCVRNWQGFKAEWITKGTDNGTKSQRADDAVERALRELDDERQANSLLGSPELRHLQ